MAEPGKGSAGGHGHCSQQTALLWPTAPGQVLDTDKSGRGRILHTPMRFRFEATNNEAEYEALIAGLRIRRANGFGLPGEIISDNGKQFRDNPFKDWCEKLCIRQCFASVKHPQANGLVERANRSLV
ncbi:reverse transcriptase domain-containing protein [Tanacetum coccineum]